MIPVWRGFISSFLPLQFSFYNVCFCLFGCLGFLRLIKYIVIGRSLYGIEGRHQRFQSLSIPIESGSHSVSAPSVSAPSVSAPSVSAHPASSPSASAHPASAPSVSAHPASALSVSAHPASASSVSAHPASSPSVSAHPASASSVSAQPASAPSDSAPLYAAVQRREDRRGCSVSTQTNDDTHAQYAGSRDSDAGSVAGMDQPTFTSFGKVQEQGCHFTIVLKKLRKGS